MAPDKFTGSLSAPEAAGHIGAALQRVVPAVEVRLQPVADGGDGTLDAVLACGFTRVPVKVCGPTGLAVDAAFGRRGDTALVELAEASGSRRLPGGRAEPMLASSYGTGELVRAALDEGAGTVVLGVGGSACTDGGAGMLQALGARLRDAQGQEVGTGGGALADVVSVDLSGLDSRLAATRVVLASDVDNPLVGREGAAAVYAPQKGASQAQVAALDGARRRWARVLTEATGHDMSRRRAAGAAGGVGFAALAALGAELRPGIELILDLVGFDDLVDGARLVITGEGSFDRQSLRGKAAVGVAAAAARHGVPTVGVVGRCTVPARDVRAAGLRAVYTLESLEPDLETSLRSAGALLERLVATRLAPDWFPAR